MPTAKETGQTLVLASASPRRKELLAHWGVPFHVVAPHVDEEAVPPGATPEETACRIAHAKARAVAERHPHALVIGADTIVADRWGMLGKPRSADDARRMLRRLRARRHRVITGVALVRLHPRLDVVNHAVSHVTMRAYTDAEIAAYVASGDPLDKAGAYAIQHPIFAPASAVVGCYCNVVGLPLLHLCALLRQAGFALPQASPAALPRACARCTDAAGATTGFRSDIRRPSSL
ncbi:MAG: Maf family protein [Dehalococcoidia bacterium]|nr:Maf family protein [Dehalococcoidia bacterium]